MAPKAAVVVALLSVGLGLWMYDGPFVPGHEALERTSATFGMTAAQHVAFGPQCKEAIGHCLVVREGVALPSVGRHDVLIRVHAASVNPVDFKMVEGFLELL